MGKGVAPCGQANITLSTLFLPTLCALSSCQTHWKGALGGGMGFRMSLIEVTLSLQNAQRPSLSAFAFSAKLFIFQLRCRFWIAMINRSGCTSWLAIPKHLKKSYC